MKLKGWLIVVVAACGLSIGAVIFLQGMGLFRDIEQTEAILVGAWVAVCFISILITLVRNSKKKARRPRVYNRR